MLAKIKYSLLSIFSLCISIAAFHTVAYAQTPHQQINSDYQDAQIISRLTLGSGVTPTQTPHLKITSNTPTPSPIIEPTEAVPTPTSAPVLVAPASNAAGANAAGAPTNGLNADILFSMVNNHRTSIGLHELQKDEKTCSLAAARASEIAAEMAAGTLHSGMYGRNLPYWNTENAIALGSEEAAFNWWLNEPVHRASMESKVYTHSCTACSGKHCVQEFTSYQPK